MSKKTETIFIIRGDEPVIKSWGRDVVSFGSLMATAWFLNTQMQPSGWINFAVAVVWIIWLFGKASRHRIQKTPAEARVWLDEQYPDKSA